MLTPAATRNAHRAAVSLAVVANAAAPSTRSLPIVIRQRRHSSSKHSSTPKQTSTPPTSAPKDSASAAGKRKSAKTKASKETGVKQQVTGSPLDNEVQPPSVPSTAHIDPKSVYLASLFAQHRPLSLQQPVPTNDNQKSFDAIFAPRASKQRTKDVIFTLASAVKHLELAAGGQAGLENGIHSQPQTLSLEELAKTFRPFNAPPPPVPMDPAYQEQATQQNTTTAAVAFGMEEPPMPEGVAAEIMEKPMDGSAIRTPFRTRMRVRQEKWLSQYVQQLREQWSLISVKRQRKAKMKKHKYKKLMKRTRNLRRRLDRL